MTFTFPHIGNIGTNDEDIEDLNPARRAGALGAIFRAEVTNPSNYRSQSHLDNWLKKRGIIAMSGIDTRALTALIREKGLANAVLAHSPDGEFDVADLKARAGKWHGLVGLDLAKEATSGQSSNWSEAPWVWNEGYADATKPSFHVVAVDFGVKRNILRLLAGLGAKVTIVPASTSARDILALGPDGIFLSNGPGDPEATGEYAVPMIRALLETDIPIFGICLGHQMLALALGAATVKMHQGHHGANHPVKDFTTGKVEIVSMNHGFCGRYDITARRGRSDPSVAVRQFELWPEGHGTFGVFRSAPPGSLTRSAGFTLPVPALRQPDPRTARRAGNGRKRLINVTPDC